MGQMKKTFYATRQSLLVDKAVDRDVTLVLGNTAGEPEGNLALSGLDGVGAVADVAADLVEQRSVS